MEDDTKKSKPLMITLGLMVSFVIVCVCIIVFLVVTKTFNKRKKLEERVKVVEEGGGGGGGDGGDGGDGSQIHIEAEIEPVPLTVVRRDSEGGVKGTTIHTDKIDPLQNDLLGANEPTIEINGLILKKKSATEYVFETDQDEWKLNGYVFQKNGSGDYTFRAPSGKTVVQGIQIDDSDTNHVTINPSNNNKDVSINGITFNQVSPTLYQIQPGVSNLELNGLIFRNGLSEIELDTQGKDLRINGTLFKDGELDTGDDTFVLQDVRFTRVDPDGYSIDVPNRKLKLQDLTMDRSDPTHYNLHADGKDMIVNDLKLEHVSGTVYRLDAGGKALDLNGTLFRRVSPTLYEIDSQGSDVRLNGLVLNNSDVDYYSIEVAGKNIELNGLRLAKVGVNEYKIEPVGRTDLNLNGLLLKQVDANTYSIGAEGKDIDLNGALFNQVGPNTYKIDPQGKDLNLNGLILRQVDADTYEIDAQRDNVDFNGLLFSRSDTDNVYRIDPQGLDLDLNGAVFKKIAPNQYQIDVQGRIMNIDGSTFYALDEFTYVIDPGGKILQFNGIKVQQNSTTDETNIFTDTKRLFIQDAMFEDVDTDTFAIHPGTNKSILMLNGLTLDNNDEFRYDINTPDGKSLNMNGLVIDDSDTFLNLRSDQNKTLVLSGLEIDDVTSVQEVFVRTIIPDQKIVFEEDVVVSKTLRASEIVEETLDAGVMVENVLLKDGLVNDVDIVQLGNVVDGLETSVEDIEIDLGGFPQRLKNLTDGEIQQLENIGVSLISPVQWVYLSQQDQTTSSISHVEFGSVTSNIFYADMIEPIAPSQVVDINSVEIGNGTVDGVDISSFYSNYLALEQEVGEFPVELKNLTTFEIQQVGNIGTNAISATQWNYLSTLDQQLSSASSPEFTSITVSSIDAPIDDVQVGGVPMGSGLVDGVDIAQFYQDFLDADASGFPVELKDLTPFEIEQLQNINTNAISETQWRYLSGLNQSLSTTSSPQFLSVSTDTISDVSGNGVTVDGVLLQDGLVNGFDISALDQMIDTLDTTTMKLSGDQTAAGVKSYSSPMKIDQIDEYTADEGVLIEGVLLQDGFVDGINISTLASDLQTLDSVAVKTSGNQSVADVKTFTSPIKINAIDENTAGAGVTIDGVLLKDSNVNANYLVGNFAHVGGGTYTGYPLSIKGRDGGSNRDFLMYFQNSDTDWIWGWYLDNPTGDFKFYKSNASWDSFIFKTTGVFAPLGGVETNTINERTSNAGVTIDGVLIKDGLVDGVDVSVLSGSVSTLDSTTMKLSGDQTALGIKSFPTSIKVNQIDEHTSGAGVTIDGVLLRDGIVQMSGQTLRFNNNAGTRLEQVSGTGIRFWRGSAGSLGSGMDDRIASLYDGYLGLYRTSNQLRFHDPADTTKNTYLHVPLPSTTGTTTTITYPSFTSTLATLDDLTDLGSNYINLTDDQTALGIKSFPSSIKVDQIDEYTADAGVTVDGLLIKDSNITFSNGTSISESIYDGDAYIDLKNSDEDLLMQLHKDVIRVNSDLFRIADSNDTRVALFSTSEVLLRSNSIRFTRSDNYPIALFDISTATFSSNNSDPAIRLRNFVTGSRVDIALDASYANRDSQFPPPAAIFSTFVIPHVPDSSFMMTAGNQTVDDEKTFTSPVRAQSLLISDTLTNSPKANLHIQHKEDAVIWIESDSDNVTETDNPMIRMTQDGGLLMSEQGWNVGNFNYVNLYSTASVLSSQKFSISTGGLVTSSAQPGVIPTTTPGTEHFYVNHVGDVYGKRIVTDNIDEKTTGAGVTIDGVLMKDSNIMADRLTFPDGKWIGHVTGFDDISYLSIGDTDDSILWVSSHYTSVFSDEIYLQSSGSGTFIYSDGQISLRSGGEIISRSSGVTWNTLGNAPYGQFSPALTKFYNDNNVLFSFQKNLSHAATITLHSAIPSGSPSPPPLMHTNYTIPYVTDCDFMMTAGEQTVDDEKTFTSRLRADSLFLADTLTNTPRANVKLHMQSNEDVILWLDADIDPDTTGHHTSMIRMTKDRTHAMSTQGWDPENDTFAIKLYSSLFRPAHRFSIYTDGLVDGIFGNPGIPPFTEEGVENFYVDQNGDVYGKRIMTDDIVQKTSGAGVTFGSIVNASSGLNVSNSSAWPMTVKGRTDSSWQSFIKYHNANDDLKWSTGMITSNESFVLSHPTLNQNTFRFETSGNLVASTFNGVDIEDAESRVASTEHRLDIAEGNIMTLSTTSIRTFGNQNANGVKSFDDGIRLGGPQADIFYTYMTYSGTASFTGPWSPMQTIIRIERIGQVATMFLGSMYSTASRVAAISFSGYSLPIGYRALVYGGSPSARLSIPVYNQGVHVLGLMEITGGSVSIYRANDGSRASFSGTGAAGITNITVTYFVADDQ